MILKNKKILITGASRGLGEICARALADQDAFLVLMARSKDKLEKIHNSLKLCYYYELINNYN